MSPTPTQPADAPAIAAVDALSFPHQAWDDAAVRGELVRTGAIGVHALPDGFALGWALAGEAELVRIAVTPSARRSGLGGRLLDAFLRRAAAHGAITTWLEVRDDNTPALALYSSRGFTRRGLRRRYYADGSDAVIMGQSTAGAA